MKPMPKWLLVPPAVALLLLLGPLSMQGSAAPGGPSAERREAAPEVGPTADPVRTGRATPTPPRTPDLWQMSSALVGVLLLGVGGVYLLRRLRGPNPPTRGAALATLRQTLRLSARQAVHAIEFDDRILLVGEHERGLCLLESGRLPERAADEAEVLARGATVMPASPTTDGDDGAVPRNLVIPRPDQPRQHRFPTPPATAPARGSLGLNDFRTLLQKAGRA